MTKNTGRWILLLSSSLFPHNQKTKETLHLSIFEINVQSRIETEKMEQSIVNEKNPKCSGPRFISFLLPHRGVTKEINEREISLYGFRFVRRNVFSVAPSSIPPPRSEELKAELENSEATREISKRAKRWFARFLFCPVAVIWPARPLVLSRPGIKPGRHRCAGSLA